ncbi:MAG: peptidylprolyl isomerase [Candidatus Brevundimonas colombiensis]|uniref:peptidylprolyl isomerase n=1 Tax=Candidatus Brevundimonas colombiensis TaxID=3121376 RepID=A0AAJ5WZ20_9CAUL|nr:peptidylprolyl isomerase [Brevundimonas sp.]WEK39886.1 MAG: peptidylprolyl isomerase [Brevundimonas sp.]
MVRNAWAAAILTAILSGPALAQEASPPPPPPAPADWRVISSSDLLVIDTTKGRILVELAPELAPAHVERIKVLTARGFYDNLAWHRVIDWFMAQTGDPLGTGDGQSWYPDLKGEFTFRRGPDMAFTPVAAPTGALVGFVRSVPVQTQPDALMAGTSDNKVHGWALYCPGVAGMARDEGNDTANSQFFLMRQAYPALDKRYTVWGRVVSGLDVVRALKASPNPDGIVTEPDRMTRVRLAADLPQAERPTVQVMNATSAAFRALADQARQSKGADFSVCDIDVPVQVTPAA